MTTLKPEISSITRGPRQSNFELLRIIAMFMVLMVHADFFTLGQPKMNVLYADFWPSLTRVLLEDMAICCVNVFVLISGWFGIKATMKGFCNFLFQCVFICTAVYAVALAGGWAQWSVEGVLYCLQLTDGEWFVKSYIALYILAPVLNAYIKSVDTRRLGLTVAAFYAFQTVIGWPKLVYFTFNGYSAFCFIGLYLMAQWLRQLDAKWFRHGGWIYLGALVLNLVFYYITRTGWPADDDLNDMAIAYISPFAIACSAGLLVWASTWRWTGINRFINYVAGSAFAVYLFHYDYINLNGWFRPTVRQIYENFSGPLCVLVIFAFLVAVFAMAVIVDQPRKWLWRKVAAKCFKQR